jgi:hypothetical protein
MTQITRFPFVFWGMRDEPEAIIDGQYIIKGDKRYEVKKSSRWIFLMAKYLLIAIGLIFVFSRFDFIPSVEKFLQYALALLLIFLVLALPKKYIAVLVGLLAVLLIVAVVFGKLYFISYTFKYCLLFFVFFTALLDSKKTHYFVLNENKKVIANIITEEA